MSEFDPVNRPSARIETSKSIVPERIREACAYRGYDYAIAADRCAINTVSFGRMANGHIDIPDKMIFKLMAGLDFPKKFFYQIRWERV